MMIKKKLYFQKLIYFNCAHVTGIYEKGYITNWYLDCLVQF
jgi:hypothetical protein